MNPRAQGPTTRASILAAGLVRIVRTPAELDAAGGWWTEEKDSSRNHPDVKRARSEGMRPGLPYWLRPPVTPREAARRMNRDAEQERRTACEYIPGKRVVPVAKMSPARLRGALNTQFRRLSRGWDDTALDVTVTAPDPAALELEPVAVPAVAQAPAPVVASDTFGTPLPPRFEGEAPAPALPAPSTRATPVPVTCRPETPTRIRFHPRGRDRLAWLPVMQRLARLYAAQPAHTPPDREAV